MALTQIDDRGLKTPIDLLDNEKIRLGTGNDLELYHDASHSRLVNGTGNLLLDNSNGTDMYLNSGNDIYIRPQGSENGIKVIGDAAVELYYDDSKKLETTSSGATISGANPVLELAGTANTSGNTFLHINANANHWCIGADNYTSQNLFVIKDGTPSSSTHRFAIDASGRIGIGTTSPGSFDGSADDLVINGSGNTGITINSGATSSTSEGNLVFAEGNGSGGSADEWRGVIQYKHGDDYMRFLTDNSERMRIDSSGKVSVGGETPIYNFNVRGSGQQVLLVGSTDAGGAYLTLDGDSNGDGQSGDYCSIGHTTAGNLEIIADNPNGNANVIFKAGNAAEAFRIDSAGRLKINHSDHQSQLDNTFISVYDSNGGGGISKNYAMMQVNNYGTGNNGDTAGIGFGAGAGNSYIKGSIGFMRTGGYGQGDFTFNLNTDNSNALVNDTDEVVRIRKEGGITFNGDTAAANALDDFEEGSWTATVYWSSSNTTGGYTNTTTVTGNYTKIGGVVAVTVSVNPSTMNSGSNCWISYISLPFQPSQSWGAAFAPYSGRGNYGGTLDRDDFNVPYAQFSSGNGGTIVPLVTGMGRGAGYWGHYSGDSAASATISGTYMTNS